LPTLTDLKANEPPAAPKTTIAVSIILILFMIEMHFYVKEITEIKWRRLGDSETYHGAARPGQPSVRKEGHPSVFK
jgi:hypothetical protein